MATETGVWCNGCFLPAAIRLDLVSTADDGTETPVGVVEYCPDHGMPEPDPDYEDPGMPEAGYRPSRVAAWLRARWDAYTRRHGH
jgi:hypothetical protein